MVFFNYATMQMAAKIVYYGPGLCGKTTNLHYIYAKTSPQSRGEMVSLETETDRTLFFDLLPIDVGVIGGFKTRLQLYTIPGQVFYNTTRKLVLKGVDGLVFVADSQVAMKDANLESFKNLRENLAEIGLKLDDIPLVLQFNKRDLPSIADVDMLRAALDPDARYDFMESVAATGVGVFETLKLISKLTLRTLRRRMTGDEPAKDRSSRGSAGRNVPCQGPIAAGGIDHRQNRPIAPTHGLNWLPRTEAECGRDRERSERSRAIGAGASRVLRQHAGENGRHRLADHLGCPGRGLEPAAAPAGPHAGTGDQLQPDRKADEGARRQARQGSLIGRHHGGARGASKTRHANNVEAAEERTIAA